MDNKINIFLKNKNEYINDFNNERISPELDTYILTEAKTIHPNKEVIIEIRHTFKMNDKEKNKLKNMIKLSYKDDIEELTIFKNKVLIRDITILLLGILILIIYSIIKNAPIISEFILIIGWVLIWESIYSLLFSRTENNIKVLKRQQLMNSKVEFIEVENGENI